MLYLFLEKKLGYSCCVRLGKYNSGPLNIMNGGTSLIGIGVYETKFLYNYFLKIKLMNYYF